MKPADLLRLDAHWREYAEAGRADGASEEMLELERDAFYAGAGAVLGELGDMASRITAGECTHDDGANVVQAMRAELMAYADERLEADDD